MSRPTTNFEKVKKDVSVQAFICFEVFRDEPVPGFEIFCANIQRTGCVGILRQKLILYYTETRNLRGDALFFTLSTHETSNVHAVFGDVS